MYIQGTVNINHNRINTIVSDLTADGQKNIILESKNDYVSANITSALAISDIFDIEAQYFYYEADNFVDNSEVGLPYGTGAKENGVSAGVVWHTNTALLWSIRYYHFSNRDETFGSLENYDLDLLYLGVQYRF